MNYFAHGCDFIDDPYFLAGTAVPDWLQMMDRKIRARSKYALPFADESNELVAALARGILQHHHDDAWFHQSRAFVELSMQFSAAVSKELPPDDGFRPSFLGHILVELLLDSELIAQDPPRLDLYYEAIDSVDPQLIAEVVSRMTSRKADRLAWLIGRFSEARFLSDYSNDAKLLVRLNQVMRRVKLPQLPDSLGKILPEARQQIRSRMHELLERPTIPNLGDTT